MNCTEGAGESARIVTAFYSVDDKKPVVLEPDGRLTETNLAYGGRKFPQMVLIASLGEDDLAKALRISISYCWASAKTVSQEERLKLLWGAFNALYRYQANRKTDASNLDAVAELFLKEPVLNRALRVYSKMIEPIGYDRFVRWKVLTSDRSRALSIKNGEKEERKLVKKKRLILFDRETLECMRDYGCGNVEGKKAFKAVIDDCINQIKVEADDLNKVAMLLCRYIYIYRCNGVHANTVYPIFDAKRSEENHVLSDLLEAAIIDYAEWLAKSGAQRETRANRI